MFIHCRTTASRFKLSQALMFGMALFATLGWQHVTGQLLYTCQMPSGEKLFTDRPCPTSSTASEASQTLNVFQPAAPTRLHSSQKAEGFVTQTSRNKSKPSARTLMRQRKKAQQASRCQQARKMLTEIKTKRRQGYRVAEARDLDQLEATNHRIRREDC